MWNKLTLIFITILFIPQIWACPVCEKQQPKITQGLTHGSGPQGNLDWMILITVIVLASLTLIYSIKYLLRPGEKNANHIKHTILIA